MGHQFAEGSVAAALPAGQQLVGLLVEGMAGEVLAAGQVLGRLPLSRGAVRFGLFSGRAKRLFELPAHAGPRGRFFGLVPLLLLARDGPVGGSQEPVRLKALVATAPSQLGMLPCTMPLRHNSWTGSSWVTLRAWCECFADCAGNGSLRVPYGWGTTDPAHSQRGQAGPLRGKAVMLRASQAMEPVQGLPSFACGQFLCFDVEWGPVNGAQEVVGGAGVAGVPAAPEGESCRCQAG